MLMELINYRPTGAGRFLRTGLRVTARGCPDWAGRGYDGLSDVRHISASGKPLGALPTCQLPFSVIPTTILDIVITIIPTLQMRKLRHREVLLVHSRASM